MRKILMYLYVIGLFQLSNLVQGKESRMPSSNNENEMNRKIEIDYQVDFLGRPCVLLLEASSGQNEGDIGSSTVKFQNAKELFKRKDEPQFSNILNTVSCLIAIVEAEHDDISHLIEMVNGMQVEQKYLQLRVQSLDISLLQNKTTNYDVGVYQSPTDDLISLCPVVGRRWAQIVNGACPKLAKNLHGKELNISFIGILPFITQNPIKGSEILLMKLLAHKFNFRPKFIPERSYDIAKDNGTLYGMIHRVMTKQSEAGMGQTVFASHRYKLVDYLQYMYDYPFTMFSQKPREIVSYDTLIYPFDNYVWAFTWTMITSQFILLVLIQNLWSIASGKPNPRDYIFQDLLLSLELIPRRRLNRWIQREGFKIRKLAILKWIVLGNVITIAYKSTLLSSLVTTRYEDSINTLNDLDRSGIPLVIGRNTIPYKFFANSPRTLVRKIFNNSRLYDFSSGGKPPPWMFDMFEQGQGVVFGPSFYPFPLENHRSKESPLSFISSWIVPKGSQFQQIIENSTGWLRDTGILNRMKDGISPPHIPTQYQKARNKLPLSIKQLGIVLIVLLSGIILSIIVFFLELMKGKGKKGNLPSEKSIELKGIKTLRESSNTELQPSNQQQSDSGIALHRAQGKTKATHHK